jgi:hypothetical protein
MSLSKESIFKSIESLSESKKRQMHLPESVDKLLEYINRHGSDNIPTYVIKRPLPETLTECVKDEKDLEYITTLFENKALYNGVLTLAHHLQLNNLVSMMTAQYTIIIVRAKNEKKTVDDIATILRKGGPYEHKTNDEMIAIRIEKEKQLLSDEFQELTINSNK